MNTRAGTDFEQKETEKTETRITQMNANSNSHGWGKDFELKETKNKKFQPQMDTNEHGCRKGTIYKEGRKTGKK